MWFTCFSTSFFCHSSNDHRQGYVSGITIICNQLLNNWNRLFLCSRLRNWFQIPIAFHTSHTTPIVKECYLIMKELSFLKLPLICSNYNTWWFEKRLAFQPSKLVQLNCVKQYPLGSLGSSYSFHFPYAIFGRQNSPSKALSKSRSRNAGTATELGWWRRSFITGVAQPEFLVDRRSKPIENGPGLKIYYFLLKMGIFQPAMLVYRSFSRFSSTKTGTFVLEFWSKMPRVVVRIEIRQNHEWRSRFSPNTWFGGLA